MAITYRGETFEGYNKPKRTTKHPRSSHAVLAKEGDQVKLIRFGQQGVSGRSSKAWPGIGSLFRDGTTMRSADSVRVWEPSELFVTEFTR